MTLRINQDDFLPMKGNAMKEQEFKQAMKLNDFIDAQLEIESKATPGPWSEWVSTRIDPGYYYAEFARGPQLAAYWEHGPNEKRIFPSAKPDAAFIKNARNNYRPLLLALKGALTLIHCHEFAIRGDAGNTNLSVLNHKIEVLLLAQQQGAK